MTGPYPPCLWASRLDGRAPSCYSASPLTKEREKREKRRRQERKIKIKMEMKDWPLQPPCLILAGTSQHPWPPESPSLLYHISPWGTAPIPVPAGSGPLCSALSFPPSFRAPAAGISTGCRVGGDAPVFGLQFPHTTSTCHPLSVRTVLGKLRWAHARTPVGRILLPMTLCLLLGQVCYCLPCPSVSSRSIWCTCRPPTVPWLLIFLRRFIWLYSKPKCMVALLSCFLWPFSQCSPDYQHHHLRAWIDLSC
jgi:hypothetical protein